MDLGYLIEPAVVAAVVPGLISVVGLIVLTRTARRIHAEKLIFDRGLAELRFAFDKEMAERKFSFDRGLHDHERRVELAQTNLAEFQQLHDIIRAIRSPMSFAFESTERPRSKDEWEAQSRQKNTYFVPLTHIEKIQTSASPTIRMIGSGQMAREKKEAPWLRCEEDIWYRLADVDPLEPKVQQAIIVVEDVCRPVLERKRQTI